MNLPLCPLLLFIEMQAKHWRVVRFQCFAISQVHVNTAGQAGVKTPHRAHDINAFELVWSVLLEDRSILYRVFVWTRRAVDVTRIGVPGRGRIWMLISNFSVANHNMMREHAANGFVEPAANRFFRHFEISPCACASCMQFA